MLFSLFHRCILLPLAVLLVLGLWTAPTHAEGETLSMGLISADSKEIMLERWQPILDDMSQALGVPIKGIVLDDYAGIIWYLATGKAQIAWVGNKSAIEAVDRAHCEVLVKTLSSTSGEGYYSHLITHKNSPLLNETDVIKNARTLTFGNGDPNSTSGFVVPGYYLFASKGLDPNTVFKRVLNNNHEGNFHAVVDGLVDVATSNSQALARYMEPFPEKSRQIKIIWTSPLIPNDPIVVRKDLPPTTKAKLRSFFINYGKQDGTKTDDRVARETAALLSRNWGGFKDSDNSQLTPIRKLELFKQRVRVEQNEAMPDKAKKRRLKEIDTQLKQLDKG